MTPTELTERHGPRSRHGQPPPEDGYHARMPSGLLLGQRHDTADEAGRHLHREWVWYAPLGEMEPEYWGGDVVFVRKQQEAP